MIGPEDISSMMNFTQEDYEAEATAKVVADRLTQLAREHTEDNRVYTGHDVADILEHDILHGQTDGLEVEVRKLLAEIMRVAQDTATSIEEQIDHILLSGRPPMQKRILEVLRNQPDLFTWIKLSSV